MLWYNILRDNKGKISNILQLDPMNSGLFLLDVNVVFLERDNHELILMVKIMERKKSLNLFDLNIKADTSRVVKKNVYFFSY